MAVYAGRGLDYAIERVSRIAKESPEEAVRIMKKHVYGRNGVEKETGRLQESIKHEYIGTVTYGGQTTDRYAIGPTAVSDNGFPYGEVIMHGRGPVTPGFNKFTGELTGKKYLKFHWRKKNVDVYSKGLGPWRPKTNFVLDTARELQEWVRNQ